MLQMNKYLLSRKKKSRSFIVMKVIADRLTISIFLFLFFISLVMIRSLSIKIYSKALMLGHLAMDIPEIIYILN